MFSNRHSTERGEVAAEQYLERYGTRMGSVGPIKSQSLASYGVDGTANI